MTSYSIDLSSGITESFLANIHPLTDSSIIRKRLTEITIELLQNIRKHSAGSVHETLIIKKHRSHFSIESENQIHSEDVAALENKISFINSLDKIELKKEHTRVLHETSLSEKSGAGLGFYRIAMRTKSILNASFKPLNHNHHIFTLNVNLVA